MGGAGSPEDLDEGTQGWRGARQLLFSLAWQSKAKASGWRRAHHCLLGSMLLHCSWSHLCLAKFFIWWHTQAGWHCFLKTTILCYFILIFKSVIVQHKSVKCSVEQYCFLDMERSTIFSNPLFCFFLSSLQVYDFLFSILKMQISASILSCK